MADTHLSWLLALLLLGAAGGLRSFTPMAAVCWFAHLGYLPVDGTWASWTAPYAMVIVFTLLALAEYVGDKLPAVPNRTTPAPLLARIVFAGLGGAICAASTGRPAFECVLLAALGALAGAFLGFAIRRGIVQKLGCADWPIAVGEDMTAILTATFALHIITG